MRIFISYRRGDSSGHAGRLFDALQARFGHDHVFMDISGIDSGENFVEAIDRAIRSCDALVAVIGDEWLTCTVGNMRRLDSPDDFVRTEIATALERGIPVVPVLVEQTSMPSAASLPEPLKPLATRNAHELTDARWSYDVERLIAALEKLGGKPPVRERLKWVAMAAVVIVTLAIGLLFYRLVTSDDAGAVDAATYAERGTRLLSEGRYDEAIQDLDRALAIEPRAGTFYNRGLAHFSKNDVDQALADWNRAIALDPRDARAHRQRGGAYFAKGDFNLAIADFNRAIELEPKEPKAYYNRGLVFKARGEEAKAAADFTTVVTLGSDPAAATDAQARLAELPPPLAMSPPAGGTTAAASAPGPSAPAAPRVDLTGEWTAEVKYSWGDTHPERFSFKVDGTDVLGTASFLRVRRGILDGTLTGNRVVFRTETQEILGNQTRDVTHRYRGTVSGDEIAFYMQSEGASSSEPVEFTARRARPVATTPPGK
jgi:cytochrome c-type biogenesis protein CcmH/NrfG